MFVKSHDVLHLSKCIATAKSLQSCPTLCDPIDGSPPGSPSLGFSRQEHWSGCHFLLQCLKVKSESEVAQSYPTLSDPMDCSPPGSSIHGIFQARVLEWGAKISAYYASIKLILKKQNNEDKDYTRTLNNVI